MHKLAPLVIVIVLGLASVASANLLVNGDFSQNGVPAALGTTNISSWSSWGSSGYYNDDIDSQMSVKIWWDDSGLWQDWSATAGEAYTLAVDARQQSTDPLVSWRGYLKVEFYNSTNGQIASQELDYLTPTDSKDTWLQLSGTYTAPVDTVYGRILLGMNNWASNAAGSVYFDNASVVAAIPEPTMAALFGFAGLIFLAARRMVRR